MIGDGRAFEKQSFQVSGDVVCKEQSRSVSPTGWTGCWVDWRLLIAQLYIRSFTYCGSTHTYEISIAVGQLYGHREWSDEKIVCGVALLAWAKSRGAAASGAAGEAVNFFPHGFPISPGKTASSGSSSNPVSISDHVFIIAVIQQRSRATTRSGVLQHILQDCPGQGQHDE